jgi:CRP-like cAMP-binding protein
MPEKNATLEANLLLASFPAKEQRRLLPRLKAVTLRSDESLHELGQRIEYVHFPMKGCLISVVKVLDDGKRFDAGVVGYEGMVGAGAFFGDDVSFGAIVRVGGATLRIKRNELKGDGRGNRTWSEILGRYVEFLLVSFSQVAACNLFHPLEKRFCAWLLTVQDRISSDEIPFTHALVAQMLGVRRAGITEAAQKCQQAGLIRCGRRKFIILDRERLKANACVCYQQHTQAYQRLLDPAWPTLRQ